VRGLNGEYTDNTLASSFASIVPLPSVSAISKTLTISGSVPGGKRTLEEGT
jgi:hypothetical protein